MWKGTLEPAGKDGTEGIRKYKSAPFTGEMKWCVQHGMIALGKEPQRINWEEIMQETDGSLWHCKQACLSTTSNTDKNSK